MQRCGRGFDDPLGIICSARNGSNNGAVIYVWAVHWRDDIPFLFESGANIGYFAFLDAPSNWTNQKNVTQHDSPYNCCLRLRLYICKEIIRIAKE